MTIKNALAFGAKKLKKINPALSKKSGASSAAPDASVLLCEAMGKSKEFLYTYPEKKLTAAQEKKYKNFIRRRAKREPVAYILGKKEFYGLEFLISPAVLIPRPETETLISAVLSTIGSLTPYSYPQIIDIGTGSGAIAITLKKLLPKAQMFATDTSASALTLAKKNSRRLKAKIIFKKGNLLKPFFHPSSILPSLEGEMPDLSREASIFGAKREGQRGCLIITANLPYLSRAEWQKCQPEVKKYEPKSALIGGKIGIEIYKRLFWEIAQIIITHSTPLRSAQGAKIIIFAEIGYNQKRAIEKLARQILKPKKVEFFKDLADKWRVARIVVSSR